MSPRHRSQSWTNTRSVEGLNHLPNEKAAKVSSFDTTAIITILTGGISRLRRTNPFGILLIVAQFHACNIIHLEIQNLINIEMRLYVSLFGDLQGYKR